MWLNVAVPLSCPPGKHQEVTRHVHSSVDRSQFIIHHCLAILQQINFTTGKERLNEPHNFKVFKRNVTGNRHVVASPVLYWGHLVFQTGQTNWRFPRFSSVPPGNRVLESQSLAKISVICGCRRYHENSSPNSGVSFVRLHEANPLWRPGKTH